MVAPPGTNFLSRNMNKFWEFNATQISADLLFHRLFIFNYMLSVQLF